MESNFSWLDISSDFSDKEGVRKLFDILGESDLREYYDKEVIETSCLIDSKEKVVKLMRENKPLVFVFNDDNDLYYKVEGSDEEIIFDIDMTKSYVKSDDWLSSKLLPVAKIFPSVSTKNISREMVSFYTSMVIAICLPDLEEEFIEVATSYDYENWKPDGNGANFEMLLKGWMEIGSVVIKMIASAAKYALLKQSKKKQFEITLELPGRLAIQLANLQTSIGGIRRNYDDDILSVENRKNMSKLEIKNIIAKRDMTIEKEIQKEDYKEVKEVYHLSKINSRNINPIEKQKIIRFVRKNVFGLYKSLFNKREMPSSDEEKILYSKLERYYRRELLRAKVNKFKYEQFQKYKEDVTNYVAPNFV